MRRVCSQDTQPEIIVRKYLHHEGFRFRLHRKNLPGKPDLVLTKYQTVIFVHGCFWHRHPGCKEASTPSTRRAYWLPKFQRTVERDKRNKRLLMKLGWRVLVIWECETKNEEILKSIAQAVAKKTDRPLVGS
jgi:DNA mismatch endonuclease (patch repair protein)